MIIKFYKELLKNPLPYLLSFGVIQRLLIIAIYQGPTIFPDTKGYLDLSHFISNFSFDNYGGGRTPGYPFLLAICGRNLYLVVITQQVIGLISTYLIYDFSYMRTQNKTLSFWITFITITFVHFTFYELVVLTETLSLFLVILIFWLVEKHKLLTINKNLRYYVLLSIIMGLLYLTRPMFIYLPIAFAIFYVLKNVLKESLKTIPRALAILVFPILFYYGYCSINKKNTGYFTTTIYFGYNLTQMATSFFDKVPDEHKTIRNIFLKHRANIELNKPEGEYPMTIWYAYDDLAEATNLTSPDLSNELKIISTELFKSHPELYLKQVFISWIYFWGNDSTFLVNKEKFTHIIPKYLVYGIWKYLQQYFLVSIHFLFVLFSLKPLTIFLKLKFQQFDLDLFLVLFVMGGSIAQALVAFGNNSRFAYPYLPLIVYFVLIKLNSITKTKLLNATHSST